MRAVGGKVLGPHPTFHVLLRRSDKARLACGWLLAHHHGGNCAVLPQAQFPLLMVARFWIGRGGVAEFGVDVVGLGELVFEDDDAARGI